MYREELEAHYASIRRKFFPQTNGVPRPKPQDAPAREPAPEPDPVLSSVPPEHPPEKASVPSADDAISPITSKLNAMRKVALAAAAHFGVHPGLLYIDARNKRVCEARAVAFYLCRDLPRSFPQIGRHFGRDHSTIMHSVRKVHRRLSHGDRRLHDAIEAVRRMTWRETADCCPLCGSPSMGGDFGLIQQAEG